MHASCVKLIFNEFFFSDMEVPGSGTSPRDRRYFDPKVYRIIILDQRGSGLSKPTAELKV